MEEPVRDDSTTANHPDRVCPWCGSSDVTYVSRGYAGATDAKHQYARCNACDKLTYEMIAKSAREMRLGRYKPGDQYLDREQRLRYTITRVLRVGANEFLLYVKPLSRAESTGLEPLRRP